MLIRRVSKKRLMVWALVLLSTFALGLWAGIRIVYRDPLTEFPYVVRIAHSESGGPAYGGIEVRDRRTINFLDTLFPNYRQETKAGPPTPPSGEHSVLEFNLERSGYAKKLFVWSEGDKEFWSAGRDRLPVQGSFRRVLEWLPVRRAIEMAIRPSADRSIGKKLLADARETFSGIVIDNARHQVGQLKFWAIRDLLMLVEFSVPRTAHRTGSFPIYHWIDGLIAGPLSESDSHISDIRRVALDSLASDTGREASAILALTANEATIDELAKRLEATSETQINSQIIICLQGGLGLPQFQPGGMCGNSSHAEFEQFRKNEEKRTNEAKAELLAWYAVWKTHPTDRRHVSVLAKWETELVRKPYDGEHLFEQHDKRFRNLLRRGTIMLPAVQEAQAQSSDLRRRGALESLKAFWTGVCDRALVEELLQGDRHAQILACDIIVAANDNSWNDQLLELIDTPQVASEVDVRARVNMVEKATETLVMCHDIEDLLRLSDTDHQRFSRVRNALQRFRVPQGD